MKLVVLLISVSVASIADIAFVVYRKLLLNSPMCSSQYELLDSAYKKKSSKTVLLAINLEKDLNVPAGFPIHQLFEYSLSADSITASFEGKTEDIVAFLQFHMTYVINIFRKYNDKYSVKRIEKAMRAGSRSIVLADAAKAAIEERLRPFYQAFLFACRLAFQFLCSTDSQCVQIVDFFHEGSTKYLTKVALHYGSIISTQMIEWLSKRSFLKSFNSVTCYLGDDGQMSIRLSINAGEYVGKIRNKLFSPMDPSSLMFLTRTCKIATHDLIDTINEFRIQTAFSMKNFDSLLELMKTFDPSKYPPEIIGFLRLQMLGESNLHLCNPVYHATMFYLNNQLPVLVAFLKDVLDLSSLPDYIIAKQFEYNPLEYSRYKRSSHVPFAGASRFLHFPFLWVFIKLIPRIASNDLSMFFARKYHQFVTLYIKALIEFSSGIIYHLISCRSRYYSYECRFWVL